MSEKHLSCEGDQPEGTSTSSSSRGPTPSEDEALVAGFSEQICLRHRHTSQTMPNSRMSSRSTSGRGRQRRSRPAQRPRKTDFYFEPCCACRTLSGFKTCNPGPAQVPKGSRRKDGKIILPCPGCVEPRVPPLPNECFAFCKLHVNDFNSCRVHQTPKKCAKK